MVCIGVPDDIGKACPVPHIIGTQTGRGCQLTSAGYHKGQCIKSNRKAIAIESASNQKP